MNQISNFNSGVLKQSVKCLLLILVTFAFLSACSTPKSKLGIPQEKIEQQTFLTPEELVAALKQASEKTDKEALYRILGPDGRNLLFSGDEVSDSSEIAQLSQKLKERAELIPYSAPDWKNVQVMKLRLGKMGINAGIPIINSGTGWRLASGYFAPRAVKRRIATNEIEVWRACVEFVNAQRLYNGTDWNGDGVSEYAQKIVSTAGKQDGLYWKETNITAPSPLADLAAQAETKGYGLGTGESKPFNGYLFKVLKRQGKFAASGAVDYVVNGKMTKGFALIAYPIEWGVSGLRSFVINSEGNIYGKNLGVSTDNIAENIQEYNPDRTWVWIQQPQLNEYEQYLDSL